MRKSVRLLLGALLLGGCAAAWAHTGHGTHGVLAGLAHPLGLDHLLAIFAVGVWAAAALPAGRRVAGPAVFMLCLLVGAAAATPGAVGGVAPLVENGIATSVVLFGAMLIAPRTLSVPLGLTLVGGAALLHGLAHGAELPPGTGFAGYAMGFLATTALLHGAGLAAGQVMARGQAWVWRVAGAAVGAAGLVLLAQA